MLKKFYFILFLCFSSIVFAQSISQSLYDAETYISVGQNKVALNILKNLDNLTLVENAERDYLLGKLYFSLGKFHKANEFYDLAALAYSDEPKYLIGLSESYFALGKLKIAKSNAEFALRSNPDLVRAELILAKIEDRLGNKKNALQRFKKLYELQPRSEPVILNYAKFLESRSEIGNAIDLIENFLLKSPDAPPPIGDGSSYLIPVDAQELSIANSSFSTGLFYSNLSNIPAQNITVLIDACFSGISNDKGSFGLPNSSPLIPLEYEIPTSYTNLNIMTAGSYKEIASWTKDQNHTLLTKYFLIGSGKIGTYPKKIKNKFNPEFINFVQINVKNDAKKIYGRNQIPQIINRN